MEVSTDRTGLPRSQRQVHFAIVQALSRTKCLLEARPRSVLAASIVMLHLLQIVHTTVVRHVIALRSWLGHVFVRRLLLISSNKARLSSGTAVRSYRSGHTNLTWNNDRYHQQFSSQRACQLHTAYMLLASASYYSKAIFDLSRGL